MSEDSIMKPTKYCLKERSEGGNLEEEMNWIKVHCMHLWKYHNETPLEN
jgi:hypothetical protein